MRIRKNAERFALAIAIFGSTGASAQVTPGQVGDTLKRPETLKPAAPATPIETQPQAPAGVTAGGKQITVSRIEFSGNTLFSDSELQAIVSSYTQRPVTLLELYEAADRVADFYVSRGYTLASVTIPPQKISSGSLQMVVSEGRIARITVENNALYTDEEIRRYFPDRTSGSVYRGSTIEDSLRVINTLPGMKARAVLKPGERYGSSDLIVRAEEKPIEGSLNVDNYGRKDIGEFRISALAQFNNPLKVEDKLTLLALRSSDGLLTYGFAEYSLPANFDGARIKFSYGEAQFDVRNSPVDGRNRSGRLLIEQSLLNKGPTSFSITAGVSRTLANADFTGATFSGTAVSLLELGGTLTHSYDNLAVTQLNTSIHTNFKKQDRADLFTPSGVVSHGHEAFRLEMDVQHLQPLPWQTQLLAHVNGVYSPDPLVDTEAYSLGGPTSIRGFPAGEVRGDRGYFGSLTWRKPVSYAGALWIPRVFAESGKVLLVDAPSGASKSETLSSAGVGLDFSMDRANLRLDWAFPLDNHAVSDGRDNSRLFANLSVSF